MRNTQTPNHLAHWRQLSPLRKSTDKDQPLALAEEQATHFGIDPASEYGQALVRLTTRLYESNADLHVLWQETMKDLNALDRSDRIARFNAKRFLSFQFAKMLDSLQNPSRSLYQSLTTHLDGAAGKGAYPLFDNVTALFSATPVITRTATYFFACSEWVEDAFKGREPLHEIYSRLLNPTSICLANHIVDLECGDKANEYMAWNFNSGMAAIDAVFSHLLGYEDIVLASRNVYGGTFQLLHDWYGKGSNLNVGLAWVDAYEGQAYANAMDEIAKTHAERIAAGRQVYIYLESPCNPHGYVLDVAGICRAAHQRGWRVIVDATVGTPFLQPLLKQDDLTDRPDFVIHSYTKDLAGSGATTAGVVIGRNEDMFLPKGETVQTTKPNGDSRTINWNETLFWNVYYIKGGFLDADKAFEVLNGMRTYELRVLQKCINTIALAKILDQHQDINVSCPALPDNPNHALLMKHMRLGLPGALFTINVEGKNGRAAIPMRVYKRFLDNLEPALSMQITLGQTNTIFLCPAATSHSEMSPQALQEAGIHQTTTRISVGLEDPRTIIAQLQQAAETIDAPEFADFAKGFPSPDEIDAIYRETYLDVHQRYLEAMPSFSALRG